MTVLCVDKYKSTVFRLVEITW